MSSTFSLAELKRLVAENPGAPEFYDLAEAILKTDGLHGEAREILLRGLTENPGHLRGRLLLARLFYLDRMPHFAGRELVELRRRAATPALDRLISALGEYTRPYLEGVTLPALEEEQGTIATGETILGELEIDSEFEDVLDEIAAEAEPKNRY